VTGGDAAEPRSARESKDLDVTEQDEHSLTPRPLWHVIHDRLRALVVARMNAGSDPGDPYRGLYVAPAAALALCDPVARDAPFWPIEPELERWAESVRAGIDDSAWALDRRLLDLVDRVEEELLDAVIVLLAAAPSLDRRLEGVYGFLNDDVTRRAASIGLIIEVCGHTDAASRVRARLASGSLLVRSGLLEIEGEEEASLLRRSVRLHDDVVAYLAGHGVSQDDLPTQPGWIVDACASVASGEAVDEVCAALRDGSGLVYCALSPRSMVRALGVAAFRALGAEVMSIAADQLGGQAIDEGLARTLGRRALLGAAGLVIAPIEPLLEGSGRAFGELVDSGAPMVLAGRTPWDVRWAERVPYVLEVPQMGGEDARRMLALSLDALRAPRPPDLDTWDLSQFALTPDGLARAVGTGWMRARSKGRALSLDEVAEGVRLNNASGLNRLAQRVRPRAGWDALIVDAPTLAHLRGLAERVRYRYEITSGRNQRGAARVSGVVALFAGEPGTGKTLAAEIIARELGLDLYVVNLATVVDKYVGETEKNLEAIFSQAEGVNGVLFFDEADALFGKRTEGGDAHDRYANIEVAYLLQRVSTFDGLVVLATNLRGNMDPAFVRRLDVIVHFAAPMVEERRALWSHFLSGHGAIAADVDLDYLAESFRLSGGAIENACLTAAFDARGSGGIITMASVVRATQRELEKLGRLSAPSEFGPYAAMLDRGRGEDANEGDAAGGPSR